MRGAIGTFSGGWFFPLKPRVEDVRIEDIAHALSLICRFTGHVETHYSVAEHCVHVSRLVPAHDALAGLLHDAAEAYIADVSGPVKHDPRFKFYRDAEARLQSVIFERYGLPQEIPASVHRVDATIVAAEARVMFQSPPEWAGPRSALDRLIQGYGPRVAERVYLERFKELTR